jgi:Helix-turn-helix domain
MSREGAGAPPEFPAPNEPFAPRQVFRGSGALVPEQVAASKVLSMTAKVCYGHLIRRAGKNARCWPSYRDIAKSIGIGERQAIRALRELTQVNLIRPIARRDKTKRQTSNEYEFIWDRSCKGTVTNMTPSPLTNPTGRG